jgi:hypothetical protein
MSAIAGKDAKVSFGGTDISTYVNKAGSSQVADKNEASTFGVTAKKYQAGLTDGTSPLEGPFDPAFHAIMAPKYGTEDTFVYQPAGTGSGLPRFTVQALLLQYDVESDVNGIATIKGSLQFNGEGVWDVNP